MAKSVEVKLNEALDKLKKTSAKKYKEVFSKMREAFTPIEGSTSTPIERQLAMVEAALGIVKESKSSKDFLVRMTALTEELNESVEPRQANTPISKKNGADFVEGNPFNITEGRRPGVTNITESDKITQRKKRMFKHLVEGGKDPREARAFLGIEEPLPEGLDERQAKEYKFARRCGISEADAMTLAKMPLRTRA